MEVGQEALRFFTAAFLADADFEAAVFFAGFPDSSTTPEVFAFDQDFHVNNARDQYT
ncbi:hypothetical protein [Streptomyces anulatus]|uniref:hypothetical protein n=1 Tax=Streptomyces anulatus TaxID=1892 RepID=UPI0033F13F59